MDSKVLAIIFVSTLMHAGWNLMARGQKSEMAYIHRLCLALMVLGFLPVMISELMVRSLPGAVWLNLLMSGSCCGIYLYGLGKSYETADFTIVYPVARALPVLLIGLADVWRGQLPTMWGWVGMLGVSCGCFLAPLHSFGEFHWRRYFNRSSSWILLTALGTVGYSVIDKISAEMVAVDSAGPATAARYSYVFFTIAGLVFFLIRKLFDRNKLDFGEMGWIRPGLGALFMYAGYGLILWVFQMTSHASYVVAFRQFSIIIGVIMAFLLFRERGVVVRVTGALLITAGLVLIVLFGGG